MPKKPKPKVVRTPTKHQLTRWEKEKRVTRAFMIGAAVIVALVVLIPAFGYYREVFAKGREAIATVNGKSFSMDSYTRHLSLREYQMDAFISSFTQQSGITGTNSLVQQLQYQRASLPSTVVTDWVNGEAAAIAAPGMGVSISADEITQELNRQLLGDSPADQPVDPAKRDADAKERLKRLSEITGITTEEYRRTVEVSLIQDRIDTQLGDQVVTTTLQIRALAIVTASQDQADAAYKRVQDGEDFAKVAQEVSIDPQSQGNGGELGWLPKGLRSAEFDSVAFGLNPGQLSEPFSSAEGFTIVRVLERDPVREMDATTLSQVKSQTFTKWQTDQKSKLQIAYYISSDKQFWAQDKIDKERAKQLRQTQQQQR